MCKRRRKAERTRMLARLARTTVLVETAKEAVLSRLSKRERQILNRYLSREGPG